MSTLARTRPTLIARVRAWPGGWEAGAVLLAGMALVALTVTLAPGVDVHRLHVVHGDGVMVHALGGDYPGGWVDPNFDPFTTHSLHRLRPLLALVYLASVCALGAPLVSAIRGAERWPAVVRALAGFLPGFLMVLAPLQLLFAAVPLRTAPWVAMVAMPAAALLVQRRALVDAAARLRGGEGARSRALLVVGGVVGVVALCAIHRLQGGRYFMIPDSIRYYMWAVDKQAAGQLGTHLAQWAQQSDEWVFNAPLIFAGRRTADQQFVFWCTQFVALASFCSLIYGVVWSFARRRRAAAGALAVGLILATTPSIYPWDNIVIIGGQNPGLFFAHPGRQIGVLAPWIALLLLGRPSRRATVAILLAAAGLAFTTTEGAGYTALALAAAGAWRLLAGRRPRVTSRSAAALHATAAAALLAPPLAYYGALHSKHPDGYGWVMVGGTALAALGAMGAALASAPRPAPFDAAARRASTKLAACVAAAFATGLLLSNNMVGNVDGGVLRRALAHLLPGYGTPLQTRDLVIHPTFPDFTRDACLISGYCTDFGYFVAVYGFTLVLALAGWVGLGRVSADADVNRHRAAWLLIVGALGTALAIVDFTGLPGDIGWVMTRFVEVPYFALLAFSAIVFVGARNRFTALTGTTVLVLWTIVPFLHSHVVEQWARNASWLVDRLG